MEYYNKIDETYLKALPQGGGGENHSTTFHGVGQSCPFYVSVY